MKKYVHVFDEALHNKPRRRRVSHIFHIFVIITVISLLGIFILPRMRARASYILSRIYNARINFIVFLMTRILSRRRIRANAREVTYVLLVCSSLLTIEKKKREKEGKEGERKREPHR